MEGFQVHLGGSLAGGDGSESGFGRKVRGLKTTADQLPDYVERVLSRFTAGKQPDETFAQWTVRASDGGTVVTGHRDAGRAVPFYCPYCGEEDLEPQGIVDGDWHCRSCTRSFQLRFAGIGAATVSSTATYDDAVLEEPHRMEKLVAEAAQALADAPAEEILRWATDTFGDRICVTSSMTDAVIIHVASQIKPGIDVVFLDTGYHFPETVGTRDAVAAVYPVNLINVTPSRTVAEQDAELGPRLYGRNPDLCCYLRKVEPLERALSSYDAWITGVRRDETVERREARVVEWDGRREMVKVNPIVSWSGKQVDDYIAENGILVNPLVYDGYPSIGCATCTRKVAPGENPRAGRWAGTGKTECGIHL